MLQHLDIKLIQELDYFIFESEDLPELIDWAFLFKEGKSNANLMWFIFTFIDKNLIWIFTSIKFDIYYILNKNLDGPAGNFRFW